MAIKITTSVTYRSDGPLEIRVNRLESGTAVSVTFHCRECGGYLLHVPHEEQGDMAMAYCKACGVWFGRLAAIRVQAALAVQEAGYKVDHDDLENEAGVWRSEQPPE